MAGLRRLGTYLGGGWKGRPILVDKGTKGQFLETQLKPELLQQACQLGGVALDLQIRTGYDHS
jgi:S-formylglutathione hydrolase